jgi:hypothetical protein
MVVKNGQHVEFIGESEREGWCGTASEVDESENTAFIILTHKPDCTELPNPVPLGRFSGDVLGPCHCQ